MMRYTALVTLCALAVPTACTAYARELAEVEDTIIELAEKIDSYTAQIEMKGETLAGPIAVKMAGKGFLEGMKKDDKNVYRFALTQTIDLGEEKMDSKILTVFTGDTVWTETDMSGQTMVVKAKPDTQTEVIVSGGRESFKQLHEQYDIALRPDTTVNEEAVFVLELRLKQDDASPSEQRGVFERAMLSFSQKTGLPVKMVMLDADDNPLMQFLYKDYQINPTIDPARFDYTPPDGAIVMDAETIEQMGAMF